MNEQVTMQTKGLTQDKDGIWGIWRTLPRLGRTFIHVGETGKDAARRRITELLNTPIGKEKKNPQKQYSNGMTAQEFAIWYDKLGEYKRDGYFDVTRNGEIYIPIENKIIITSGTYEKPIAKKVLVFKNEERLIAFLKRNRGLGHQ